VADFVIREWNLAPDPGDQAPPHVHHGSDEAFYVLDGQLEVLSGTERRIVPAGQLAMIGAGTVHTFANRGPDNCRVLAVMTPEIDELIAALHDPDADRAAVWKRYNSEVVPSAGPS
jgi:mannose-6-phosphate isomerase-like protein (cupin superfamily)